MGATGVGKTSVINRFINNSFYNEYDPTSESEIYRKAFNLNENEPNKDSLFFDLEIIDMLPHDHEALDQDVELMSPKVVKMY